MMAMKSPTVICITETWLSDTVDSPLVAISGYCLCRCDRSSRRGGGTAVYIKEGTCFLQLETSSLTFLNCDCCWIDLTQIGVLVICTYIPPSIKAEELSKIHELLVHEIDNFLTGRPGYHLVILGDFNQFRVPLLCSDLSMVDIVKKPTRGMSIYLTIFSSQNNSQKFMRNRMFLTIALWVIQII